MKNPPTQANFYCTEKCGHPGFSIAEWNAEFKALAALGLEMPEPKECETQCDECINIVLDAKAANASKYGWAQQGVPHQGPTTPAQHHTKSNHA